jgi:hypothetical protein
VAFDDEVGVRIVLEHAGQIGELGLGVFLERGLVHVEEDGALELHDQLIALPLDGGGLHVALERFFLHVHVAADDRPGHAAGRAADRRADGRALPAADQGADSSARRRASAASHRGPRAGLRGTAQRNREGDDQGRSEHSFHRAYLRVQERGRIATATVESERIFSGCPAPAWKVCGQLPLPSWRSAASIAGSTGSSR